MGQLKPGATYIYERAAGVTYAREAGEPPESRVAIGWDYKYRSQATMQQWEDILKAAETDPSLQDALNLVVELYRLSKHP